VGPKTAVYRTVASTRERNNGRVRFRGSDGKRDRHGNSILLEVENDWLFLNMNNSSSEGYRRHSEILLPDRRTGDGRFRHVAYNTAFLAYGRVEEEIVLQSGLWLGWTGMDIRRRLRLWWGGKDSLWRK
jgi:hypothetical protein